MIDAQVEIIFSYDLTTPKENDQSKHERRHSNMRRPKLQYTFADFRELDVPESRIAQRLVGAVVGHCCMGELAVQTNTWTLPSFVAPVFKISG